MRNLPRFRYWTLRLDYPGVDLGGNFDVITPDTIAPLSSFE